MDYKEKYEHDVECIQEILSGAADLIRTTTLRKRLQPFFPELKESKDDKIMRAIRGWIYTQPSQFFDGDFSKEEMLAWVEKHGKQNLVEWSEEDEKIKESIKKVLANTDFNRLDIKFPNSAYTSNKDVIEFADKYSHTVWEKLMDNFKKIENYHIGCNDVSDIVLNAIINTYNWLEKQDKEECALKSSRDEDVDKFMRYIEKQAKAYEFNLPNRGYDIYGFAKDILTWLEKQDEKKRIFNADDWYVSKVDGKIHNAKFIEKQDENKPTDEVEPKFKVRDWIVRGDTIAQILDVQKQYYVGLDINGKDFTLSKFLNDDKIHLWTIEDAKDGDVLVCEDENFTIPFIAIYKCLGDTVYDCKGLKEVTFISHCFMGFNGNFYEGEGGHVIEGIHPATKEQRNLLFRKMKETGYVWDVNKKELKTIEQNPTESTKDYNDIDPHFGIPVEDLTSTDKTEPKFKVGNWYQCIKDFFGKGVIFDKDTAYYCAKEGCLLDGCHIAIVKDLYDNFKLWTIEDAKDGDVLTANVQRGELGYDDYPFRYIPITFIYRKTNNDDYYIHSHCDMCFDGILKPSNRIFAKDFIKDICPAAEGQHDLLFQKIKEEGYEWDDEEKEIKRIELNTLDDDNVLLSLSLGNNQVQDILEDMGMLDDNGQCPHTAEEIFKAGMEHAFNLNREAASSVKVK